MKTDVTDFYPYSWIRESKTRLAKTIGKEKPWPFTTTLLCTPGLKLAQSNCDKFVFYDAAINNNDIWSTDNYKKRHNLMGI
jgi:hypothetical protein